MSNRYFYFVHNEELRIAEKDVLVWRGKPKNLNVKEVLSIPGTDDCIVLLDLYQAEALHTKNLLRCDPGGHINWESGFPLSTLHGINRNDHECYGRVRIENNMVIATSLSGFADYFEIETGKIIKSEFVK
jgi:hypothetical protein